MVDVAEVSENMRALFGQFGQLRAYHTNLMGSAVHFVKAGEDRLFRESDCCLAGLREGSTIQACSYLDIRQGRRQLAVVLLWLFVIDLRFLLPFL